MMYRSTPERRQLSLLLKRITQGRTEYGKTYISRGNLQRKKDDLNKGGFPIYCNTLTHLFKCLLTCTFA